MALIKKSDVKSIINRYQAIVNKVTLYNKETSTVLYPYAVDYQDTDTIPKKDTITSLRKCINFLEYAFSENCDCLSNSNCCQTCQGQCTPATGASLSCQSTGCQSCQAVTCQSTVCQQKSCQAQCATASCQSCEKCQKCENVSCESCQDCQVFSCQTVSCQGECSCQNQCSCQKECDCQGCQSCQGCQIASCQSCQKEVYK